MTTVNIIKRKGHVSSIVEENDGPFSNSELLSCGAFGMLDGMLDGCRGMLDGCREILVDGEMDGGGEGRVILKDNFYIGRDE